MSRDEFFRQTQSPQYTGRAIAMLAADPKATRHTGKTLATAELSELYGFTDIEEG